MAIERLGPNFILYCDICGDVADENFDEFQEAVDYKKEEGWRSQKGIHAEWEDVCPKCRRVK